VHSRSLLRAVVPRSAAAAERRIEAAPLNPTLRSPLNRSRNSRDGGLPSDLLPYAELSAAAIVALIRSRKLSCVEVVTYANKAIADGDGSIRAFAAVAGKRAIDRAEELDELRPEQIARLPLFGVPVAIKDVFDTATLPTAYGSPIYAGYRPHADAAVVTLLLAAGAIVVGKTKTSEFACMSPTDTRNPLDLERTPGGSSSGSAAAVAARMVPLATGTQTAGSIVRPASYCGILGLKPSFGAAPLAGSLPTAVSLDTAGLFARSVEDLELALGAITGAPAGLASSRASRPQAPNAELLGPPRIGFLRIAWDSIEDSSRVALERYLEAAAAAGARIEEIELPVEFELLADAQLTIQLVETAAALGAEADWHGEHVSLALREYIAEGRAVAAERYEAARRLADEQRWRWSERIEPLDAVLAPSTLGVPPLGLESTGDPLLCRPFTLLGGPALALPGALSADGLPVGMQLVGAPQSDRRVLAVAAWLGERLGSGVSGAADASKVGA
jgi:Asp-tRNA(Asn)/Glu-tRNA(Gln) amidotransferase A subunit family amidase